MPRKRPEERWILAIDDTRQQLVKSIALFTEITMSELVETAIEEYVQKIQTGDYRYNLEEMKRKKKESIRLKKMLAELEKIRLEYSDTMHDLGIEELAAKTLAERSLIP